MRLIPRVCGVWPIAGPALATAAANRLALAAVVWLSLRALPRLPLYPAQLPDSFLPSHPALDGWARWDAAHYVAVAQFGYGNPASPSPLGGYGFFPLYPLLMRAGATIGGDSRDPGTLAVAAIIVSVLALLAASIGMALLAAETVVPPADRTALLLLLVSPFAVFLTAAYSESLFLALAIFALLLARRDRWLAASVLAALASATRLVGLLLLPAILLLAYRRGASRRSLLELAVVSPAGFVAFILFSWRRSGSATAYFDAQSEWGGWNEHVRFYARLFALHPKDALLGDPRHLIVLLNVGLLAACLATIPLMWRWLDAATACFSTLLIVVQGAITWVSLGRYLIPAVGVYLVLARVLARPRMSGWPRDALLLGSATISAGVAILYAHGFWVV